MVVGVVLAVGCGVGDEHVDRGVFECGCERCVQFVHVECVGECMVEVVEHLVEHHFLVY